MKNVKRRIETKHQNLRKETKQRVKETISLIKVRIKAKTNNIQKNVTLGSYTM